MSPTRVLVAEGPTTASALRTALGRRGHDVRTAATLEQALEGEAPDLLVTEIDLPDGTGFELLDAWRQRGATPRAVFVTSRPTHERCRQALLVGASDFLAKPFRIEELVRSVDAALTARPRSTVHAGDDAPADHDATLFERTFTADADGVDRATRELAAHLVRLGAGPSCRTRVVSAAAELCDNVRRHAYAAAGGRFRARLDADPRTFTLTVEDRGAGFDAGDVAQYAFESPEHNGLARVACLAEDVQLEGAPGRGACVTARFAAYRVDFDEDAPVDLTELDHLTPELARHVLATLADEDNDDPFRLSPAMAVAVGRLLAGPNPEKRLQLALWS